MVGDIISAITEDGRVTDRELVIALAAIGAYAYAGSRS
jgi:hypothetical protein